MRMTLPESYRSQLQHIHESPKFAAIATGERKPVPFPGYTIVTPPWSEETVNLPLQKTLATFQDLLLQKLPPGLVVPLPVHSLHLTLADLIWDSAYRHAVDENPQFEQQLRDRIGQIFRQCQPTMAQGVPLQWQILGLMIMPRAIGVCLVPRGEESYNRLLEFRRALYQNHDLMSLGIEQQYHLTAHITLGYFADIPADLNRDALTQTIMDLNHQWIGTDAAPELSIYRAELQKFDDMTYYYREADWPSLDF